MTPQEILALPLGPNDAEAATIRDYLKALLSAVWKEQESFDGKRPFGNSDWDYDMFPALIKAGAVKGDLDEDGRVNKVDEKSAHAAIQSAIEALS